MRPAAFIWNVARSSAHAPYAADSSMHRPGLSDPLTDSFAAALVSDRKERDGEQPERRPDAWT